MQRIAPRFAIATTLLLLASAASATTYRGIRNLGGSLTGYLEITTDGTTGVLGTGNVLQLKLTLSGLGDDAENYGANPIISGNLSTPIILEGTSLSATPSKLFFDFDAGNGCFGVATGAYYLLTAANCASFSPSLEFMELDPEFGATVYQTGVQLLGNVPEPASWAMLIAGFGLVGAALRRRRAAAAAAMVILTA